MLSSLNLSVNVIFRKVLIKMVNYREFFTSYISILTGFVTKPCNVHIKNKN